MEIFKNKKIIKAIAIGLVFNLTLQIIAPLAAYAGIGHINGPETPASLTDSLVDLSTGDFNYSMPLVELPGAEMGFSFGLNYNAGIMPDNDASWVGLGWNLNPGEIFRNLNGMPDDYNGAQVKINNTYATGITSQGYETNLPLGTTWWTCVSPGDAQAGDIKNPGVWEVIDGHPFLFKIDNYFRKVTVVPGPGTYVNTDVPTYGILNHYNACSGLTVNGTVGDIALDITSPFDPSVNFNTTNQVHSKTGILPAYDNYVVTGAGVTGLMEPLLLENATLFENDQSNPQGPSEPMIKYKIKKLSNHPKVQFRFKNDFSNSFTATPTNYTTTGTMPHTINSMNFGSNNLGYTYTGPDSWGFDNTALTLGSGKHISYFKNNEITGGQAKAQGFIDYPGLPYNRATIQSYTPVSGGTTYQPDVAHQIGGYSITGPDGRTYHYALPVYAYRNYSLTTADKPVGIIEREASNNQAYAYSWKLTTITGPDFVDKNNNGYADESDEGGWVNFNYGRYTDKFLERIPYSGTKKSYDGASTYSLARKEIYYLDAAYTSSHTVLFAKSERLDRRGAHNESSGGLGSNSEKSLRLDRAILLRNDDIITLGELSTNNFSNTIYNAITEIKKLSSQANVWGSDNTKYSNVLDLDDVYTSGNPKFSIANQLVNVVLSTDYSLMPYAPNSSSNNGKLTLKAVTYYGRNHTRINPSADFNYDLPAPFTHSNTKIITVPADNGSARKGKVDMGSSPNPFEEGDIIKLTIAGTTYYASLVKGLVHAPNGAHISRYDVYFLGELIPGTGDKNILKTATETKNPPYTKKYYDNWGYFKSDFDALSELENFDRRRDRVSAQGVDVWSLRRINSTLGSITDIEYESDNYSNDYNRPNKVRPKGILNVDKIGFTKVGGGNTFSSFPTRMLYNQNTTGAIDRNGTYRMKFKEEIVFSEEFYINQIVTLESIGDIFSFPPMEGDNLFKITGIGTDYIDGIFIEDPEKPGRRNPYWQNYTGSNPDVEIDFMNSFIVYESLKKYGGDIRVKKVKVSEGSGDYYETVYDYNNKVSGYSSGLTASEPLGYNGLVNVYWPGIGDAPSKYYDFFLKSILYNEFVYNYSSSNVLYEYVTRKKYGNGVQLPESEEYSYKMFSEDMLSKDLLNEVTTLPASKTERYHDRTSQVGQLLHYKKLDASNNILYQENYTYSQDVNKQGVVEQVFHTDRMYGNFNYESNGFVLVKREYPSVLVKTETKDYLKGQSLKEENTVFDFYTGQVLQYTKDDSYKNTIVTTNHPAYHIYTTHPGTSAVEMGLKARSSFNKNLLLPLGAGYTYKDNTSITNSSWAATVTSASISGFPDEALITLSSGKLLPSNYVAGSMITIGSFAPARIVKISGDRNSFIVSSAQVVANLGTHNVTVRELPLLSADIQTWSNSWTYRLFNPSTSRFDNTLISSCGITFGWNTNNCTKLWRPSYSFKWISPYLNADGSYKSSGTGTYQEFDWSRELSGTNQVSSYWQKGSVVNLKDGFSNTLEIKDINGNYSATKFTYEKNYKVNTPSYCTDAATGPHFCYPLSQVSNSNYVSFTFSGFEDYTLRDGTCTSGYEGELNVAGTKFLQTSTIKAHTGNYMLSLTANQTGPTFKAVYNASNTEGNIIRGKKYRASVWMHKNSDPSAQLTVSITGSSGSYTYNDNAVKSSSTVRAGDWYLVTLDFDVPSNYTSVTATDEVKVGLYVPVSGATSYFDDFSVRPVDAKMISYIYDPVTKQTIYSLDNDNFYTRYQYDDAQRMIATYKETIKGEIKISSMQYNFAKP